MDFFITDRKSPFLGLINLAGKWNENFPHGSLIAEMKVNICQDKNLRNLFLINEKSEWYREKQRKIDK